MKRHERSLARRCALQVLYQSEILNRPPDQVVEEGLVPAEAGMGDYARMLIEGVASHKAELDRIIGKSSKNWSVDRMPVVDRSLLRLATFELKYVDDVPVSVSINEAVELAKEFGGEDDSHRFVNGILGRIVRDRGVHEEDAEEPEAAVEEAPAADGAPGAEQSAEGAEAAAPAAPIEEAPVQPAAPAAQESAADEPAVPAEALASADAAACEVSQEAPAAVDAAPQPEAPAAQESAADAEAAQEAAPASAAAPFAGDIEADDALCAAASASERESIG